MEGLPGNLQQILQQAQNLQEKVQKIQSDVERQEIEASAGGGMVLVRINGAQRVTAIQIDKTVVNPEDIDMLQDLISAAVNEGIRKSKDLLKDEMKKVTGGIPIPGFS